MSHTHADFTKQKGAATIDVPSLLPARAMNTPPVGLLFDFHRRSVHVEAHSDEPRTAGKRRGAHPFCTYTTECRRTERLIYFFASIALDTIEEEGSASPRLGGEKKRGKHTGTEKEPA